MTNVLLLLANNNLEVSDLSPMKHFCKRPEPNIWSIIKSHIEQIVFVWEQAYLLRDFRLILFVQ